jgi:hypothetical protein
MPPQLFEVYKFEYKHGEVLYRRPWIVIRAPLVDVNGELRVLMLGCSTKNYRPGDFKIAKDAPEFPATGLAGAGRPPEDNFIDKTKPVDVPVNAIGPRKGALTGNLLYKFKWWLET